MQLGAFIITFNRPVILKETLQLLLSQTCPPDFVLVVDNGCSKETEEVVSGLLDEKVVYQSMGENLGPAGAAAYALQWLAEQGFDWIYWGDDDDPPPTPDTLACLFAFITLHNHTDVGGFGMVGNVFNWQTGEMKRLPDQVLRGALSVDIIAGNQQLILRREAIQAVGLPDARLFFGYEEPEYCLRLRRAGYRLLVDGNLMREARARAGRLNLKQRRSLRPRVSLNDIWRQYYSTRNYIFMMRQTFQRPDLAQREALKAIGRALFSWRRGPKYGTAFASLQLRGVLDGYVSRMGRTVLPKPKTHN
jgi:GT2 family glycosyltransferase